MHERYNRVLTEATVKRRSSRWIERSDKTHHGERSPDYHAHTDGSKKEHCDA